MVSDEEMGIFTAALWHKHGDALPRYIAERIGTFAVAGDRGGVSFWRDIAARADAMMAAPRQ